MYEITGNIAGFNACRQIILRIGSPLARAVRMKLEFNTSSIDERVILAIDAMYDVDKAMTGMTMFCHSPPFQPPPGSQPNQRVKISTNTGAITKFGSACAPIVTPTAR